jgi:hypothetical protein
VFPISGLRPFDRGEIRKDRIGEVVDSEVLSDRHRVSGVACAQGTSSSRHARRFAPRFDGFATTCGQAELHEAGDGLVERISILIGAGEYHTALERCDDLKGSRFRIRSADPLG